VNGDIHTGLPIDKDGDTINFLLRAHRDKAAARRYFEASMAQNAAPRR
jgi:putative transposase